MLSIIAAVTKNRIIGKNGTIPWHGRMQTDLARFRSLTLGHTMIMGLTTYHGLKEPLSERKHIVLSHQLETTSLHNVTFVSSLQAALSCMPKDEEVFVIGGGSVFKQFLPFCEKLYLTVIDTELEGDTYFPDYDESQWRVVNRHAHKADKNNRYDFEFIDFVRDR